MFSSVCVLVFAGISCNILAAEEWRPAQGPLKTRWAKEVSPDNVHAEYPRPQMVRKDWTNLNGLWDYAITPKDEVKPPTKWDGRILVPFAIESALSGVMKKVGPENRLWYRRGFELTPGSLRKGRRVLLHFGAVDWECAVWINGRQVGGHRGGYDPFSLDVTDALAKGQNEIIVSAWDPSDAGYQPRGKQVRKPEGIWYTPVTGIWQTVWLEVVPETHIASLRISTRVDEDQAMFIVRANRELPVGSRLHVEVSLRGKPVVRGEGDVRFKPSDEISALIYLCNLDPPHKVELWSPDTPTLYDAKITLTSGDGTPPDQVRSYFGMRSVEVKKDTDGFNRIFLNNQPLFQYGPLDQGWWPDGLYTAPTDEALKYDIEMTKKLGFNMCRKHVKVEPARWYYWCDKLGLLVWQDMPNGDRHIGASDPDIQRSRESEENYRREWQAIMDALVNQPSIVVWVPFNEGWGQFKTNEILEWTKQHDPTRLVDGPSGWTDRGGGDMHDAHVYPGPGMPSPEEKRAVVLGEFGGLGWPVEGHLWQDKQNWGYRTYASQQELQTNYDSLMRRLRPLIGKGLAAAIYTQTTDVEGEVNGLLTYDRELVKLDADKVARLHARLYEPPPIVETRVLVPTSQTDAQRWSYTFEKPADGWIGPDFDDKDWKQADGGFGEAATPGSVVRTPWKSDDIWLRRTFSLESKELNTPHLRIHHDENAEVYINGVLVAKLEGYVTEYIDFELDTAAHAALEPGENILAVHCHQTGGGQYIDVGLVDVIETPRKR